MDLLNDDVCSWCHNLFWCVWSDKGESDDREKLAWAAVQTCCCCYWFFGTLGFPDSITPAITAIIYEAGKCISDSGDQQLAGSQRTACRLLCPFILRSFICFFVTSPLFFSFSRPRFIWRNSASSFSFFLLKIRISEDVPQIIKHILSSLSKGVLGNVGTSEYSR